MFEIDYICEGVYDLYWHAEEDDYGWEYVTTCESYEQALEEMEAYRLTGSFSGDYTL